MGFDDASVLAMVLAELFEPLINSGIGDFPSAIIPRSNGLLPEILCCYRFAIVLPTIDSNLISGYPKQVAFSIKQPPTFPTSAFGGKADVNHGPA